MMEKEIIRVCFWTPEPDFGEVVGRALGGVLNVKFDAWARMAHRPGGGHDCVLLDLRDLPGGARAEPGEDQFEKFRRTDFSPPIVVMLGDDDPALLRRLVEAGAYDVLASPPDIVELRWVLRRAHRLHRVEMELRQLRSAQSSATGLMT